MATCQEEMVLFYFQMLTGQDILEQSVVTSFTKFSVMSVYVHRSNDQVFNPENVSPK